VSALFDAIAANMATVIAVCGSLVASMITAGVSVAVSRQQAHQERQKELLTRTYDEYLTALDLVVGSRHALQDLRSALSGRYEPREDDHSPEAEDMRRRDQAGADAIMKFMDIDRQLEIAKFHIDATGSQYVSKAVETCRTIVRSYLMKAATNQEHRFIASDFADMIVAYIKAESALADSIHNELDHYALKRPRRTKRTPPSSPDGKHSPLRHNAQHQAPQQGGSTTDDVGRHSTSRSI